MKGKVPGPMPPQPMQKAMGQEMPPEMRKKRKRMMNTKAAKQMMGR